MVNIRKVLVFSEGSPIYFKMPLRWQNIINKMAVYSIKTVQKLPVSLEEAWEFFSHPKNLAKMTPEYLNLKFTNELFGDRMYSGQVMTYKVKPLFGIPMFWMTEITHVKEGEYFIDEQRFGPYSLWHHQHHFREIDGGVEMTDLVHYKIPGWILGDLANSLFIRKQLEGIFDFRFKRVEELFGKWKSPLVLA
jgi:ligand-binding SRPBCC domain-containing protein